MSAGERQSTINQVIGKKLNSETCIFLGIVQIIFAIFSRYCWSPHPTISTPGAIPRVEDYTVVHPVDHIFWRECPIAIHELVRPFWVWISSMFQKIAIGGCVAPYSVIPHMAIRVGRTYEGNQRISSHFKSSSVSFWRTHQDKQGYYRWSLHHCWMICWLLCSWLLMTAKTSTLYLFCYHCGKNGGHESAARFWQKNDTLGINLCRSSKLWVLSWCGFRTWISYQSWYPHGSRHILFHEEALFIDVPLGEGGIHMSATWSLNPEGWRSKSGPQNHLLDRVRPLWNNGLILLSGRPHWQLRRVLRSLRNHHQE